ncbi:hypothetical protein BDV37DRAFT_250915 [Aspergillus pseudonomiae]|uniref:Uncharacterized protein n=1 Tax=Aspergillus pseudonomiae TaxID=1506151 RepID=A0A5N7DAG1_9EURO|nr:uncharacterized protein BDV37DRAFT_250915 [Aspergillus pseudonomiae]KAE8403224.1 hypothetical protein BDV37DRAFT_250915 [Aspergillus pseudonomiae]
MIGNDLDYTIFSLDLVLISLLPTPPVGFPNLAILTFSRHDLGRQKRMGKKRRRADHHGGPDKVKR